MSKKVKCALCGELVDSIQLHLEEEHPEMSIKEYIKRFPDCEIVSDSVKAALEQMRGEAKAEFPEGCAPLDEVFELGDEGLNSNGFPIPIRMVESKDTDMIPAINKNYIFEPQEVKWLMSAVEMNFPAYVWGHKGAGKTEFIEQVCARTQRPMIRVQHTLNTEESAIIGHWVVRDGETVFEYGALALAMLNGWAYLADEYDFAIPNVLSVYQAVLEGKPLFIKEAPADQRIVKPHPDFRFFATGNTNGVGDETGLYQGTSMQNAANYDRFAVVIHKQYLNINEEKKMLVSKTGVIEEDADFLVQFAHGIRTAFENGSCSDTISPRTLLFAAQLGIMHGSFVTGLKLSFINKLNKVDRVMALELAQRIFGYEG